MPEERLPTQDDEPSEATLLFREQADGRRVARLGGGKVVLIRWDDIDRVKDGEVWFVKLTHRDTYSIATPIEKARPELANPVLSQALASLITVRPAPPPAPPVPAAPPKPAPGPARPDDRAIASAVAAIPTIIPPLPLARPEPVKADPARWPAAAPEPKPAPILPSRVVGMNDRVAMFVDGANMDLACRSAGYFVDYRKARHFFLAHGLFYAAHYYIADYTAADQLNMIDSPQQRFLDFLAHSDYVVRRKTVKAIRDAETGQKIFKANVDTELVLDLINTAGNYDLAFLFSGDSDFERAVELLRSRGKRVYVVTTRSVLSRELSYVADKPIFFIEDFRAQLTREA